MPDLFSMLVVSHVINIGQFPKTIKKHENEAKPQNTNVIVLHNPIAMSFCTI